MNTTTRLLKRLAERSATTAWGTFYYRYRDLVRGIAGRMGLPPADQDEVLQETMVAAHQNLRPAELTGAQLHVWLKTVTRRKIMDVLRRRYRRAEETELKTHHAGEENPQAKLEAAWEQEWQVEVVERALEHLRRELPVKMYQAFDLYALRQHDPEQVAKTLGISRALVYLYKLRVTEKLRKEVQRMIRNWR